MIILVNALLAMKSRELCVVAFRSFDFSFLLVCVSGLKKKKKSLRP